MLAFGIEATGEGTKTYQWYQNDTNFNSGGNPISGATEAKYTISVNDVTTDLNDKYYYCVVTLRNGTATDTKTSNVAKLNVVVATTITKQPVEVSVIATKTAVSFSVEANGEGTKTYQWYQNNNNSNNGGTAISGATSNAYTIATGDVNTSLNGKYYYCVVTQNYGGATTTVTSNVAKLNVVAVATITKQPTEMKVIAGKTAVSFTVEASGEGTLSYKWYKNTSSSTSNGTEVGTGTTYNIVAANVTNTLSGNYYYCIVTQKYGSSTATVASNAVNLFVVSPVTITKQPTSANVKEGTAVTFSITATGTGITGYQWYQNSSSGNSGGTAISGATSSTYTIPAGSVTTALSGKYYYCVVTQNYGSSSTTIASNGVPLIVTQKTIEDYKNNGGVLSETNPTTIKDANGNKVVVPEGFKIASDSANDVTGGVVIEDVSHGNTTAGSQFVWIPVGTVKYSGGTKTINLDRYKFNSSTGVPTSQGDNSITSFQELATSSYENTTAKDIEAFKTSVTKNGGYYIGRYETRTTEERTITWTISKAESTNPTVNAYEGEYDGASHTITVTGGNGGTIQYSTDNKTWGATKPSRTDAGTTTIYVKVVGDSNHNDTTAISSTIKVNPKSVEVKWENKAEFIYNGQAQAPTVSATSGVTGETINVTRTTETNVGSYTSKASILSVIGGRAKKENYKLIGNTKEFTIKAYTYTIKYNGNGATEGLTEDSEHLYGEEKALTSNGYIREYTVTYNHNYSESTDTNRTATYTFNGWATTAEGEKVYDNNQKVINIGTSNGEIVNLYANWSSSSVSYKPTRIGYTFTGWYKEAECTNRVSDGNSYTPTEDVTLYAGWMANTQMITYNSNNYITGLENIGNTAAHRMHYSVNNKVVTVTADVDDGYGYINARVHLEANKTYVFNCDTNGTWGSGATNVEAFVTLVGQEGTWSGMASNKNYEFRPKATGEYYVRLDVNEKGQTYNFSNIEIREKDEIK